MPLCCVAYQSLVHRHPHPASQPRLHYSRLSNCSGPFTLERRTRLWCQLFALRYSSSGSFPRVQVRYQTAEHTFCASGPGDEAQLISRILQPLSLRYSHPPPSTSASNLSHPSGSQSPYARSCLVWARYVLRRRASTIAGVSVLLRHQLLVHGAE